MGITFDDVINNELLSDNTLKLIPSKCKCGKPLILSDSLKTLKCSDKKCRYINVDRISSINSKLKLGINYSDIDRLTNKLNLTTPYQIFMLDIAYENNLVTTSDIYNIVEVVNKLKELKSKQWYLYEIVELCGIKSVENIAYKIFDGFISISEVYDEIEQGQLSFLNDRLGVKSSDGMIFTAYIYDKLLELKEELLFCETLLKVNNYSKKLLRISFCDNNLPFINKSEAIRYMESIVDYKFVLVSIINSNTDILVRNADTKNPKFRTARIINDKYIADEMNRGRLNLSDLNKFKTREIKPIGSKIYIDTIDKIVDRLKQINEDNK